MAHRSQLLALGIGHGSIKHRRTAGRLHPVLPSVFAVGYAALEPLAFETAALLYVGEDAVLSHASAAHLWGLIAEPPEEVALTVIGRKVRARPGLRIHRVAGLDSRDVRLRHGLPVTVPARALIDLSADRTAAAVEYALNEGRVLGLVTDRQLKEAMERCPGRSGVGRLRALLAAERGPALTRSEIERRLRDIVERAELPWPQFNAPLHGHLVDALWSDARLVVETDGYAAHGPRRAFETDRRRDQRLAAAGYVVIRITMRQLRDEPMAVVARLAAALALARHRAQAVATA